jgi:hypothetical protein
MAHLMGDPPTIRMDGAVTENPNAIGPSSKLDDGIRIPSARSVRQESVGTIPGELDGDRTEHPESQLRASLPSDRTGSISTSHQPAHRLAGSELQTTREQGLPNVAPHVVQSSHGITVGYVPNIQHSTSTPQTSPPLPSVESTGPGGDEYLQQLRQHRAAVFSEIIMNSITTTLSTRIRASVANEIKLRCHHLLSEHEKRPGYAYAVLKARGKRYWVAMYEFHELAMHYGGRRETREIQLIDEVYSRRDRALATYFWALHHDRNRYAEISSRLSLPLGALLQWILQICT